MRFARAEAVLDCSNEILTGNTHLGHVLRHGDQAIGYDLRGLNSNVDVEGLEGQSYLPDFVFIRKFYERQPRIWKLARMQIERKEPKKKDEDRAMEEFVDEIEQDREMRKDFLLFRNEGVEAGALDEEMVQLKELVGQLQLGEKEQRVELEALQGLSLQ